jgi:hypothetical protein
MIFFIFSQTIVLGVCYGYAKFKKIAVSTKSTLKVARNNSGFFSAAAVVAAAYNLLLLQVIGCYRRRVLYTYSVR